MYHTDWVAEFRQKLVPEGGFPRGKEERDEAAPLVRRWLMLADQLLSTDGNDLDPA